MLYAYGNHSYSVLNREKSLVLISKYWTKMCCSINFSENI